MFDRAVRSKLRGVNGNGRASQSDISQPREDPARPGPHGARRTPDVIVFGQIARDLVLVVDARETDLLAGFAVSTAAEAEKVASGLLSQGPSLVALAIDGIGNLIAWPEDRVLRCWPRARHDQGGPPAG